MNCVLTWTLSALCIILTADSSYGYNNVCPSNKTENRPVINMCNSDVIKQSEHLFLDASAPADSSTVCHCILRASENVTIGTSTIIAPDAPCQSNMTFSTEPLLNFTCGYEQKTSYRDIGTEDVHIELTTIVSSKDATYCLGIFIQTSTGNLSIECFTPFRNSSMTASSSATTTSTPTSSESEVAASSPSTSTASNTTSTEGSTETASNTTSTATSTETSVASSTSRSDVKHTTQTVAEPTSFPVAGVAAGVCSGAVVVIGVIGVIILYTRRKTRKATLKV